MARGISSIIVGTATGVAISITGGILLASFVTAGMAPAEAAPPTLAPWQAKTAALRDREWRPPRYGPIAIALAN